MIEFSIPPKPGEVTLQTDKAIELLYLQGHTHDREALLAGAGFAIGSLLVNECETVEDATEIAGDLMDQAKQAFELHNREYSPTSVDANRFASILHYGIERGRIVTIDVNA